MQPDERIAALGFSEADTATLTEHFLDAESRGKLGHGVARIDWLATQEFDPTATPVKTARSPAFDYWESRGALGYLVLAAICADLAEAQPWPVRVVAADAFPSGHLGYWARWLAEAGLVAVLTATSPARLAHPDGDERLVGTNPIAIGLPNPDGDPIVVDVSPAKATYGDVLAGRAQPEDVVPYGGEYAYKSFALALGLQGLVESFVGETHGVVLLAAKPEFDSFAPSLRERAAGLRLPGDA